MKELFLIFATLALSLPAIAIGQAKAFPVRPAETPNSVSSVRGTVRGSPLPDPAGVPKPTGIYVLDDNSNERTAAADYVSGLMSSPAYQNVITGHAIFVPIAKILPTIATWGQFNWDWSYLDTLVQIAVSHGKNSRLGWKRANSRQAPISVHYPRDS